MQPPWLVPGEIEGQWPDGESTMTLRETNRLARFRTALAIMCRAEPPPQDICELYLSHGGDSLPLQDWICTRKNLPHWAQGITTAEAAERWASFPVEGEGHEL
jgi:hypothetical protein